MADAQREEGHIETFTRNDGTILRVVHGYRKRILSERARYSPRLDWGDEQYAMAADKKRKRTRRFLAEFARWGGRIENARVVDVGCGDGIHCVLMALQPVQWVVGIDTELPLVEFVERRARAHRLMSAVGRLVGMKGDIDDSIARLPVNLLKMTATAMEFADSSVDLLLSRSAIEHIMPVEPAFSEIARIVKPGGLIHLSTDPYFSPRGCHKTGIVDIPWAHARLSLDEYRRFVTKSESGGRALTRCRRLETLNPYTIRQWREKIEAGPFEILEWREERSSLAERLLEEYPEVRETVRDGVEHCDLINERLKIWLRRRDHN